MRVYELVLVVKSSLAESARKKLLENIKGLLKDIKIAKEDVWGEKSLSYSIKREKTAYFYVLSLEGNGVASDFEKKLQSNENILRHLLIRKK